jgi:hypothetical protein
VILRRVEYVAQRVPIPFVLAVGALIPSVSFVVSDEVRKSSPVAVSAGTWAYGFIALLLIGGTAIMYGLLRDLDEWQALGLAFTGCGCIAYAFTILATKGIHGIIAWPIIMSAGFGHVLRSLELLRRYQ